MITGISSINITVENWHVLQEMYGSVETLGVDIVNSKHKTVASEVLTIPVRDNYGCDTSVTFSGLSTSEKYYVYFSVWCHCFI